MEVVGLTPESAPRAFDPLCPIRNVTSTYPPTLLLHGDNDTDVPFEQSALMAAELKGHGVQNELIVMPAFGHIFDAMMDDPEVRSAFDRVLAFLDEQLGS